MSAGGAVAPGRVVGYQLFVIGGEGESVVSERAVRGFEDLDCWQACKELRVFIAREVVPKLPSDEKYRMKDQMLRAARSTTANIAEGYGRFHYMDNAKFCSNARGSCTEVLDHLITAVDEGLVPEDLLKKCRGLATIAERLLNGYIRYLQKQGRGGAVREAEATYGPESPPDNR